MRYISFIITLFLLSACEHDASAPIEDTIAVRIIPALDESITAGTRVVDNTWTAGDVVGVSIDNSNYKQYTAPAGTIVALSPSTTDQTLYYPTSGSTVTFRAFCPYQAPSANVVTYNAFTDQSTSAKMQAVDLVYHSGATGSKSSPTVNMAFQHKFSKVVITATRGVGVTEDLSTLAMTLTDMPTSTTFNVSGTGTLGTASGSGPITPYHYSKAAATTMAMAIVAPHAGKTGRTITFAVSGLNYSYTIPETFAFETDKAYEFNFTLTKTGAALTGSAVNSWGSGTIAWDGTGKSLTAPTEVTHYKAVTTGNTIVIKTNHPDTPVIQYSTSASSVVSPTTVTAWLTQTGYSRTVTGTPNEYTLTYNVAATSTDRTGYIHITVGTMTVVTKVTQLNQVATGLDLSGSITDPSGGGLTNQTIDFTSGYVPTLDLSGATWVTGSITYVSGNTWRLTYTLPANTGTTRSGSIKVLANGDEKTVSVSQGVIAPGLKINGVTTTVTIADDSGGGITGTLSVTCHSAYTPTITTTSMLEFSGNHTIGAITGSNGNYTISYTLAANSTGDRSGSITVTAGSESKTVNFTQKKQSFVPVTNDNVNCFIVAPGAPGISFKLTQPSRASVTISGTPSVSIIWKDTDCIDAIGISGSGSAAVVTVKPKSIQGNALIAIHSGTTVLWSYHIWVSNINLSTNIWTATGGSANGKKTFMDRNLGATANTLSVAGRGLFYQWGRKDPFPATNITYTIPGGGTGTFPAYTGNTVDDATARQNPYRHYRSSAADDWLTTQDATRWDEAGSKTVHDPCPAGWRVPTSGAGTASPWYGLTHSSFPYSSEAEKNVAGFSWGSYANWPAAGFRANSSGALSSVGTAGYYWSATVTGTNSYSLTFAYNGSINPSYGNYRANGFSVRCVQEN